MAVTSGLQPNLPGSLHAKLHSIQSGQGAPTTRQDSSFDALIGNNLPTGGTGSLPSIPTPDSTALMAAVDTNGDGSISADEKKALEDKFSPTAMSSVLQAQEQDRTSEQAAATANVPAPSSTDMTNKTDSTSTNNTGSLPSIPTPDSTALMTAVDSNGDGNISADEKKAFEDKFTPTAMSSLLQAQEQDRTSVQAAATTNVLAMSVAA
jgi:hypothetical protein